MKNNIIEFYNLNQYKDNILYINCYMNDCCNLNCCYCCNDFPRKNTLINVNKLLNFLDEYYNKFKRNIKLILLGGEPTLHPNLLGFCKALSLRVYVKYSIVSNLTASESLYELIFKLNIDKFCFSWHSQNKNFLTKLNKLFKYKDKIYIALMFEKLAFDNMKDVYYEIIKHNFKFDVVYICLPYKCSNTDLYLYTNELLNFYDNVNKNNLNNDNYKDFIVHTKDSMLKIKSNCFYSPNKAINNFKMYKCYSGLDELYIHSDNKIYPCEDIYRLSRKNIGTTDIFNPKIFKSNICKYEICSCPFFSKKQKIINI